MTCLPSWCASMRLCSPNDRAHTNDFDIDQIANSGQCFRFHRVGDKSYNLIGGNTPAEYSAEWRTVRFDCDEDEFNAIWRPYFDLDADYGRCKAAVAKRDTYLQNAVAYGGGLRILRPGPVGDYSMLYHLPAEQYRADYQVCRKFVFPFRGNLL